MHTIVVTIKNADQCCCFLPVGSLESTVHARSMETTYRTAGICIYIAGGKLETIPTLCVFSSHPMNMNNTIAAVMRAPLLAGESMPNIANTETYRQEEGNNQQTLEAAQQTIPSPTL